MIEIPFEFQGFDGHVTVAVKSTKNPTRLGAHVGAHGLPHCQASIEFSGAGYLGLFGWVQLVRSSDNSFHGRQFEIDPFDPFGLHNKAPTPYCWYGIKPTLFDAPARTRRDNLEWVAHSFLAASPLNGNSKSVNPLLGFSWGFKVDKDQTVVLKPTTILNTEDWSSHQPYLSKCYEGWKFMGMDN